jgi:quercetin dioxygenase-like cupin family protein
VTDEPARTVRIVNAHPLLDVTWSRYEPGERGPDAHAHERHADAFVVLEGELLFELGGDGERSAVGRAGTFVAVPPGVVHTFGNESGATATFLNLHAPSCGFADHLRGRDVDFDTVEPPPDGGRDPGDAIVCAPGEGERHGRAAHAVTILGELEELSVQVIELGPGFAVDPHAHDDHLDSFFLLEGETELTLGDRVVRAGPGTWAAAPPGARHGFASAGVERARLLNVHAPDAGFAASIRRRFA